MKRHFSGVSLVGRYGPELYVDSAALVWTRKVVCDTCTRSLPCLCQTRHTYSVTWGHVYPRLVLLPKKGPICRLDSGDGTVI